jgi:hypothetical protein
MGHVKEHFHRFDAMVTSTGAELSGQCGSKIGSKLGGYTISHAFAFLGAGRFGHHFGFHWFIGVLREPASICIKL